MLVCVCAFKHVVVCVKLLEKMCNFSASPPHTLSPPTHTGRAQVWFSGSAVIWGRSLGPSSISTSLELFNDTPHPASPLPFLLHFLLLFSFPSSCPFSSSSPPHLLHPLAAWYPSNLPLFIPALSAPLFDLFHVLFRGSFLMLNPHTFTPTWPLWLLSSQLHPPFLSFPPISIPPPGEVSWLNSVALHYFTCPGGRGGLIVCILSDSNKLVSSFQIPFELLFFSTFLHPFASPFYFPLLQILTSGSSSFLPPRLLSVFAPLTRDDLSAD